MNSNINIFTPNEKLFIGIKQESKFTTKHIIQNCIVVKSYEYPNIKYSFSNKMINDVNQLYCRPLLIEGYYNANEMLINRVLNGLKPTAVVTSVNRNELKNYATSINLNKFNLCFNTYDDEDILIVSKKGKLNNLFNLEQLKSDFQKSGINIDVDKFKNYEIMDFFNEWGGSNKILNPPYWITGLINGYPIENIIAIYLETTQIIEIANDAIIKRNYSNNYDDKFELISLNQFS